MLKKLVRMKRPILVLVGLFLLLWLLFLLRAILLPFGLGFLLAYALAPVVDQLESKGIGRSAAILLTYAFFLGALALLIFYAIPPLIRDLNRLVEVIPGYAQSIQETIGSMQDGFSRFPLPAGLKQLAKDTVGRIEQLSLGFVHGFVRALLNIVEHSFDILLAPIVSYYFLLEFKQLGKYILAAAPVRYRDDLALLGKEIHQVWRNFLKGSVLLMVIVGVLTTLGLYLIGMDFPVLIGILVGITNIIPYFGALLSAVPALLLALVKSKWLALYVLGLLLLIQLLEGNILSPRILGHSVGLHPLVIIFALLAGGRLGGLAGLLLAVPLAAMLKVLVKLFYVRLI
jgi:predicted PurR-regulated permease PerM